MKVKLELPAFIEYLEGGDHFEVRPPTNPYEVFRYRQGGNVGIIYRNDKDTLLTLSGLAVSAYRAFRMGKPCATMSGSKRASALRRLIVRDGNKCWYCGYVPVSDEPLTIEHLLSRSSGGNHKIENLALACVECNTQADNLPVVQKVALRELKQKERNK